MQHIVHSEIQDSAHRTSHIDHNYGYSALAMLRGCHSRMAEDNIEMRSRMNLLGPAITDPAARDKGDLLQEGSSIT